MITRALTCALKLCLTDKRVGKASSDRNLSSLRASNSMIMDNGSHGVGIWPSLHTAYGVVDPLADSGESQPTLPPQTMGKDERFHGTLNRELLQRRQWQGIPISKQPLLCSDNSTISFALMTLWDWRCQFLATK